MHRVCPIEVFFTKDGNSIRNHPTEISADSTYQNSMMDVIHISQGHGSGYIQVWVFLNLME
jgi:hypothetical protein